MLVVERKEAVDIASLFLNLCFFSPLVPPAWWVDFFGRWCQKQSARSHKIDHCYYYRMQCIAYLYTGIDFHSASLIVD